MSSGSGCAIRVVIVDDHQLFRESLKRLLETDSNISVVGEAASGREAIRLVANLKPDILLLDLNMPEMPGLAVLRQLSESKATVRTLMLVADAEDSEVIDALELGARGVLMKQSATELLFKSLRAVMAGECWIGHDRVAPLVEKVRARHAANGAALTFTPRQLDILSALASGATTRDISRQLKVSPTTVKYHLTHLFDKTGLSNRVQLALFAVEHQLDQRCG
jgi:two-component system, NarL family, nitrate/nitrite response regulator NarL